MPDARPGAPVTRRRALAAVGIALPAAVCLLTVAVYAVALPSLARVFAADRFDDFALLHRSARAVLDGGDLEWLPKSTGETNVNAPAFHLVVLPFAALPLEQATWAWALTMSGALALSLAMAARSVEGLGLDGWLWVTVGLLLFPGPYTVAVSGGLAFGLALPMTRAWLDARRGLWARAGAWLGLVVAVKLFAAVFLLYLIATRRWRALGSAIMTSALVSAAGALAFGAAAYARWARVLGHVTWESGLANGSIRGAVARAVGLAGLAPDLAGIVWLAGCGAVAAGTAVSLWRKAGDVSRDFALLLSAALLLSPLGWVHYLLLAAGPFLALAVRRHEPGARPHGSLACLVAGVVALGLPYPILVHLAESGPDALRWLVACSSTWGLIALWGGVVLQPASSGQGGVA